MAKTLSDESVQLAMRAAQECRALRMLINGNVETLGSLTTTEKGNLVAALNELAADVAAGGGGGDWSEITNIPAPVTELSGTNTGDQDLSGLATSAAVASALSFKADISTVNAALNQKANTADLGNYVPAALVSEEATSSTVAARDSSGTLKATRILATSGTSEFSSISTGRVTATSVIEDNVIVHSGSTLTLTLADVGKYYVLTNAGGCAVTLPAQASVAWPAGTDFGFRRGAAAGPISFVTTATINGNAAATVPQNGMMALKRRAADSWDFI